MMRLGGQLDNNPKESENDKGKNGRTQERIFRDKPSPLTELLQMNHFKAIYHICIFILITSFINNIAYDYTRNGEIRLGLHIILATFGKFHIVIAIWLSMFTLMLLCYGTFVEWAKLRCRFVQKSIESNVTNKFGLFLLVLYYAVFFYLPIKLMLHYDLPVISSFIILCEQVRLIMKSHAFVRENAPKAIAYKPHSELPRPYPTLKHYLYFLFAPTLIYKDEYPRTEKINWSYAAKCFLEVFAIIFYLCFILDHFFFQEYNDTCIKRERLSDILLISSYNSIPAFLVYMFFFYLLLHSWMNGFAEIMRFADREFYKDWWNSSSYARFFRTWNTIVHDWLHRYVYNEIYTNVFVGNKLMAKLMVFLISAIVHEYILAFALRYFFPFLFLLFGAIGVPLTFINSENSMIGNVFIWYTLGFGMSLMISFYNVEYAAHLNCSITNDTTTSVSDRFLPRFVTCNCVDLC